MGSRQTIRLCAPAKVNLILRVLDRLPNGYHQLWSVMQTVELADEIHIRLNMQSLGVRLHCDDSAVPKDQGNLVFRAAVLALNYAGLEVGLDIELAKKIPTAAGLGGGSSDAAATIAGVRQLLDLPWTLEEMSRLGAQLGSDVPFFLSGPSALIRGWGQDVSPLSITGDRWIVLVNPGFPIETKWAYDRLTTMREIICPVSSRLREIESKGSLAWDEVIDLMENDFEPVLFETFPMLEKLKVELCALGAETALLSGSGATVFGVFPDQRTAQEAVQVLEENKQHSVFAVRAGSGSVKREA